MTGSIHLCCLDGLSKTARFIKQFTCKVHERAFKRRHDLGYTGVLVFRMFADQTSQHHATSTDLKPALISGMGIVALFFFGLELTSCFGLQDGKSEGDIHFPSMEHMEPTQKVGTK